MSKQAREPEIENRKARHDFEIGETFECGMVLRGSEVKSIRAGQASIAEGFVMARANPPTLELHGAHIAEYPPAGRDRQHVPTRVRRMLAHVSEIRKLALAMQAKGCTLVPLKIYFKNGVAKLLVGVATGRKKGDKRAAITAGWRVRNASDLSLQTPHFGHESRGQFCNQRFDVAHLVLNRQHRDTLRHEVVDDEVLSRRNHQKWRRSVLPQAPLFRVGGGNAHRRIQIGDILVGSAFAPFTD